MENLRKKAYKIKVENRGEYVYFRGLIEISNKCRKNCLYCGIRCGNSKVERYELDEESVLRGARFAKEQRYGSVVIQGGERDDSLFIEKISKILYEIKKMEMGVTLSLGEQTQEVYREWARNGAKRYLLRIESSNEELYNKIHPVFDDKNRKMHSFLKRLESLEFLKKEKYLVGSGVMIGLPFQTYNHLDNDIKFFKEFGVDMVGMGPYIPHKDTPLGKMVLNGECNEGDFCNFSKEQLLDLSLNMVAKLRIAMPHINIAATTALQVLHPDGREMALTCGANVVMPNMTDTQVRGNYNLYEGKPNVADTAKDTMDKLVSNLEKLRIPIGWDMLGDVR